MAQAIVAQGTAAQPTWRTQSPRTAAPSGALAMAKKCNSQEIFLTKEPARDGWEGGGKGWQKGRAGGAMRSWGGDEGRAGRGRSRTPPRYRDDGWERGAGKGGYGSWSSGPDIESFWWDAYMKGVSKGKGKGKASMSSAWKGEGSGKGGKAAGKGKGKGGKAAGKRKAEGGESQQDLDKALEKYFNGGSAHAEGNGGKKTDKKGETGKGENVSADALDKQLSEYMAGGKEAPSEPAKKADGDAK
eukprot:CAMPEP_0198528916 /NCGR_PEP_ID=MMETSP1462-20131121/25438_1 /TAXON_ID=1333877 /ORGANISM="Brandtodinium nutriculum, Strain RCC3387" /LENGTH=243 /DNA_ID=CAMNT_0044258747 /DNA_START=23 /DNA_END=755 /DNA_ORIENTATION=-